MDDLKERNDLIRRGDAIDLCEMAIDDSWEYDYATDRMFEIPAVDAVEKRRGRWEGNYPRAMFRLKRCSVCETLAPEGWYCFFCGAKMDGCREEAHNG